MTVKTVVRVEAMGGIRALLPRLGAGGRRLDRGEIGIDERDPGLVEEDPLRPLVGRVGFGGGIAHRGQPDPAVLGETADHVEHHTRLTSLVEVETVPGNDVE